MPQPERICIVCPLGCHIKLTVSPEDNIENLTGNKCQVGKEYVTAFKRNPSVTP
jgi:CxxC motif-containing protein